MAIQRISAYFLKKSTSGISIFDLRERTLNLLLAISLAISTLMLFPVLFFLYQLKSWYFVAILSFLYIVIVALNLIPFTYLLKVYTYVIVLYSLLAVGIYALGADVPMSAWMIFITSCVSLLIGVKAGAISIILNVFTVWVVQQAIISVSSIPSMHRIVDMTDPRLILSWAPVILSIQLVAYIILIGIVDWSESASQEKEQLSRDHLEEIRHIKNQNHIAHHINTQQRIALEISYSICKSIASDDLLRRAANLIREGYGYSFTGVYIRSEKSQYAELIAGAGDLGEGLINPGMKALIGGTSAVGTALSNRSAQIRRRPQQWSNDETPGCVRTGSEIALPLIIDSHVLGALNIHSEQAAAFDAGEVTILQGIADHLARAVSISSKINQLASSLAKDRNKETNFLGSRALPPSAPHQSIKSEVTTKNHPGLDQTNVEFTFPLSSERREIFKVDLTVDQNQWIDENRSFVETIIQQAKLALTNTLEMRETEHRMEREQFLARISSAISNAQDIGSILDAAVREIGIAFDAADAVIELGENPVTGK